MPDHYDNMLVAGSDPSFVQNNPNLFPVISGPSTEPNFSGTSLEASVKAAYQQAAYQQETEEQALIQSGIDINSASLAFQNFWSPEALSVYNQTTSSPTFFDRTLASIQSLIPGTQDTESLQQRRAEWSKRVEELTREEPKLNREQIEQRAYQDLFMKPKSQGGLLANNVSEDPSKWDGMTMLLLGLFGYGIWNDRRKEKEGKKELQKNRDFEEEMLEKKLASELELQQMQNEFEERLLNIKRSPAGPGVSRQAPNVFK